MADCSCHLEGKDGCYRCVYSYGNQRHQEDLSRSRGMELFRSIVDRIDGWERLIDGLVPMAQSGRLEESELESKFVNALKRFAQEKASWEFQEERVDSDIHYFLRTDSGFEYHIQPQVELGQAEGFHRPTRPDFMITATRVPDDGSFNRAAIPQMAIYLDGFEFHASAQHPRFAGDIEKREQLRMHPGYVVWTFTWSDMVRFESELSGGLDGDRADFLAHALFTGPVQGNIQRLATATHEEVPAISNAPNNMSRFTPLAENASGGRNRPGMDENPSRLPTSDADAHVFIECGSVGNLFDRARAIPRTNIERMDSAGIAIT